jgi:hypothetical protein
MPENWVELILALGIAAVCLGVPILILFLILELTNPKHRKKR